MTIALVKSKSKPKRQPRREARTQPGVTAPWTSEDAIRRAELITRGMQESLTHDERQELETLTRRLRDAVRPMVTAANRRVERALARTKTPLSR